MFETFLAVLAAMVLAPMILCILSVIIGLAWAIIIVIFER